MGRTAQPEERAPAYLFLASDADSSYITEDRAPDHGRRNDRRLTIAK